MEIVIVCSSLTCARLCKRLYASYNCSRSWRFLKKLPLSTFLSLLESFVSRGFMPQLLAFGAGNACENSTHIANSSVNTNNNTFDLMIINGFDE